MSYLQAIVIALVQGVTELFPVSSLGHSVLVPAWIGGDWRRSSPSPRRRPARRRSTSPTSSRCTCATALALLWFFREDWVRIVARLPAQPRRRWRERGVIADSDPDERLAWLIVIATIPVGITGLALEHVFRTVFAKPLAASDLPVRQRPDPARRARRCAAAPSRSAVERGPGAAPGASSRADAGARASDARLARRCRSPTASASACSRSCAARRDQPLGHHDGRRPVARASTTRTPRASRSCSRRP